jgi:hypothetical protein
MFQRGQKIVILESSSPKRSHPAAGDVGYLNNMYLFFKDKFILLDAFFLSYASDVKNNVDRCERKRFVIDLNMKKGLKYKLRNGGVPRKFFIKNRYVANLTPHGYIFSQPEYMESPSITSIWLRMYNSSGDYLINSDTKIPYGQIALVPNSKKPINKEGRNALKCWIQCLLPILDAEVNIFAPDYNDIPTIHKTANSKYYQSLHRLMPKQRRVEALANKRVANIIEDMRILQVMSKFFLDGCDIQFFRSELLLHHRRAMHALWGTKSDISSIVGEFPQVVTDALIGVFFRSLLTSKNTKSALYAMNSSGSLPWSSDKIRERSEKLETIKQEANSNSAALTRIFEEQLTT